MSARRGLHCLAALASAVVVAGCATTVSGHGSIAAGVQAPITSDSTDEPTEAPTATSTSDSTADSTSGSGGNNPATSDSKVCSLFTKSELEKLFGAPVTVKSDVDDRSCDFETASNGSVMVNIYDYLNLKEESAREPGGKAITVAGRPAYQGKREIMVARSSDPAAGGLIIASNLFFDNEAKGNTIALALLNKIVPKFPK